MKIRVELMGDNALTATEAGALMVAAMHGRVAMSQINRVRIDNACNKLAEALIKSGYDVDELTRLLNGE